MAVIKLVRIPFDLILFSFDYLRVLLWHFTTTFKDMFDLADIGWSPFKYFVRETAGGRRICLPATRYGNPILFKFLYPHLEADEIENCYRLDDGADQDGNWELSWGRMIVIGVLGCCVWGGVGYGVFLCLKKYTPDSIKAPVYAALYGSDNRLLENRQSVSPDKKKQAEAFISRGDELARQSKYQEALLEYSNAVRRDPGNSKGHFGRGVSLLKLGNHELDARTAFLRTILIDAQSHEAFLHLAKLAQRSKNIEKAIEFAEKARDLKKELPEAYLILSYCYFTSKRFEDGSNALTVAVSLLLTTVEHFLMAAHCYALINDVRGAETYFRKALDADPDNNGARIGLANVLAAVNDWESSISQLNRIFEKDEENLGAHVSLAELYVQKGDNDAALEQYRKIIKLRPPSIYVRTRMAMLLIDSGKSDEAAELLKKVLADAPNYLEARIYLAKTYYFHRLYSLAVAEARKVLDKVPKHIPTAYILAGALSAQKNYDAALRVGEEMLEHSPDSLRIKLFIVDQYSKMNRNSEAISMCKSASREHSNSAVPWLKLSELYKADSDVAAAISCLRKAIQIEQRNPVLISALAMLLIKASEYTEAFELAKEAHALFPDNVVAADAFAWALYHRDEYELARNILEESVERDNRSPILYYHLGKVLMELNDEVRAKEVFKTALLLSNRFDGAMDAQAIIVELGQN